eukprot:3969294-Prymnesium_polylepis.1
MVGTEVPPGEHTCGAGDSSALKLGLDSRPDGGGYRAQPRPQVHLQECKRNIDDQGSHGDIYEHK